LINSNKKSVLITGSSDGLGRSLALHFASMGYDIILHGRELCRLEETKKQILDFNVNCEFVSGDLTKDDTIEKLFSIGKKFEIEILINNAGVYFNEKFSQTSDEIFKKIIDVNFIANVKLIRYFLNFFMTRESGLVININSIAGVNPAYLESAYTASKHALRAFSKSIQIDASKYKTEILDIYLGAMQTNMVRDRIDYDKFIDTKEASDLIYTLSKSYRSLKINEIYIGRKHY